MFLFLSKRNQFTSLGNCGPESNPLSHEVAQGFILGQTLSSVPVAFILCPIVIYQTCLI